MKMEIVSRNYKEANRLSEIVEKKLSKLDKYFGDQDVLCKIHLTTVGQDKYTMEITIRHDGKMLRAEVTSGNMYDNIDLLIPKLERQIRKFRTRQEVKAKKGKEALPAPSAVVSEEESALGKVVKVKNFAISICTPEEAVAELELLDHNFHVFVNAETNKVSVLYKRNDGDYGLIVPEY